jgi:redox-sensitive bicupin YhaK (pirin superfamily)
MFPLLNEDTANPLEIFQIWLNLPRVSKMVDPHFKMLWNEDIPVIDHQDEFNRTTTVKLIAGKIDTVKALDTTPDSWAANPNNAVGVYTVKMEANASWMLPKTSLEANRSIFYYKGGNIDIEGQNIASNHIIEALAGENIRIKNGDSDAYFLILEGKPIGEPVVQHGPFVMNTQDEIREAMSEYGKTQFGGWPWKDKEVVHSRDKGRFALHSNGKEEVK